MKTRRDLLAALGAVFLSLPSMSSAQQNGKVWRVGLLALRHRPESIESDLYGRVPRRLRELGYIEGKNLVIEWRFADGKYERLSALAEELVRLGVDVIVTEGTPGIRAVQKATAKVPIVFVGGADLVASGFVKSLARPGGNTTGVSLMLTDTIGKQVELLVRMVPGLSRLAVLFNPGNEVHRSLRNEFLAAARTSRIQLVEVEARSQQEIETAVAQAARERSQALIWAQDAFFIQQRHQLAELSLRHRLPSMSASRIYPDVGGLMCYGPNGYELWGRAAEYTDKILKGANPGDLPVEQPSKLELVINRKTAAALGLKIPPDLLVQADKVIE